MAWDRGGAALGMLLFGFALPVGWCFFYHIAEDKEGCVCYCTAQRHPCTWIAFATSRYKVIRQ